VSPTIATVVIEGMAERRILSTTFCQKRASLREIADTKNSSVCASHAYVHVYVQVFFEVFF
jgi:hypothetical protein